MDDFVLKMQRNGAYYAEILLKADDVDAAIAQANEIMNQGIFANPAEFTAELLRKAPNGTLFRRATF